MQYFETIAEMGHEQVVFCHDKASGYRGIIAIHCNQLPKIGKAGQNAAAVAATAESRIDIAASRIELKAANNCVQQDR
mgnify:CR=1 FL=1